MIIAVEGGTNSRGRVEGMRMRGVRRHDGHVSRPIPRYLHGYSQYNPIYRLVTRISEFQMYF